jgi:hypothetical protein
MPIDKDKKNIKLKSIKNYPVPKIVENYLKENLAIEV